MDCFKPPQGMNFSENVGENWKIFKQKFEIYLKATEKDKKADDIKVAMLLNALGDDGLHLYNTFSLGEEKKKIYKTVIESCQEEGDIFERYLTDLRKLAKDCDFGTQEESLVRDRIILGIKERALQERMLRESAMDLEKAAELCRAHEASKRQVKVLKKCTNRCYKKEYAKEGELDENMGKKFKCKKCATEHERKNCPAFNRKCNQCGKYGHFMIAWRQRTYQKGRKEKKQKNIHEIEDNGEEEEEDNLYMDKIMDRIWKYPLIINEQEISFKLDTGADVNVLPKMKFEQVCPNMKVDRLCCKLLAYGGSPIETL
ncbi:uncharacterized protein [Onthophagus taurus]|uniref:uncharacterized protein n=1 Tax=Onthophagus taurus TaxID=166361 RepID=UPI0039BDCF17